MGREDQSKNDSVGRFDGFPGSAKIFLSPADAKRILDSPEMSTVFGVIRLNAGLSAERNLRAIDGMTDEEGAEKN